MSKRERLKRRFADHKNYALNLDHDIGVAKVEWDRNIR